MAEFEFERRLERMFGEAPEMADARAFAERIDRRLDAGWRARRWMIGAAGVAGGLIATSQLVFANLFQGAGQLESSVRVLFAQIGRGLDNTHWLPTLAVGDGGVVWMASALAVAALGYALSRVIEEI